MPTLPLLIYRAAANAAAPLAYRRVAADLTSQGIAPERVRERAGHATAPRPPGPLAWFHAASVGESLSVLRLIEQLGEMHPQRAFLITSGTAASARIVAERLPPRTLHQLAPLDSGRILKCFLAHWRPDSATLVESELWPQLICMAADAGIPLALVNARISVRSAGRWRRLPASARHLLGKFRLIHCQDERTAALLAQLGAPGARAGLNLKSFGGPLPFDSAELERLRGLTAGRPVWLASSTHPGEDDVALAAHRELLGTFPDLLLVLVPRHPQRADAIAGLIGQGGLRAARRSAGEAPEAQTQVYLADTLGETGLWYALCRIVCLCGSFVPVGGHNPYEPAHAGCAVIHGPLLANFERVYRDFAEAGGSMQVSDAAALAASVRALLDDPALLEETGAKSAAFAASQQDALAEFAGALSAALWPAGADGARSAACPS